MASDEVVREVSYELAQPDPAALIESLRAFGYSLRTAIADLIDNSIAAKAQNIWVSFEWNGRESFISIKDDGSGMSESELMVAMRPGSKSPLEERSEEDLGRFGLGLKTASFSQCRKLTVFSKIQNGAKASRCWDLDYVNQSKEWRLIKDIESEELATLNTIDWPKGTVVLWQKMDRIVGNSNATDDKACKHFLEAIDIVKQHLEMVFHKFLERHSFNIWINGRVLKAWDPYLKNEKATQELPTEKLICNNKEIIVTPYILPHKSKIPSEVFNRGAGQNGWNAQQGFYVYRNERLLVGGDWLNLGFQKEEFHKLVRIRIDIPNSMDNDWELDVKKSRAKPPINLKADLRRIAFLSREQGLEVYRHRGKIQSNQISQQHIFLWFQNIRHGKIFYSINRKHPLVEEVFRSGNNDDLKALFNLLEESIPLRHILVTNTSDPDKFSTPFEGEPPEVLFEVLKSSFKALLNSGIDEEQAKNTLARMNPFNLYPDNVSQFLEKISTEKS